METTLPSHIWLISLKILEMMLFFQIWKHCGNSYVRMHMRHSTNRMVAEQQQLHSYVFGITSGTVLSVGHQHF